MVAHPIQTTQMALKNQDLPLTVLLLLLHAVAMGLFLFSYLHGICNTIQKAIVGPMGLFSSDAASFSIRAPFFLSLLFGILLTVLSAALFALVIFVTAKVSKTPLGFQQALIAWGPNTLFPTAFLLLAFVLGFVSLWFGLALFLLAGIAMLTMATAAVRAVAPVEWDERLWLCLTVGIFLVQLTMTLVFTRFLMLPLIGGVSIRVAGQSMSLHEMFRQQYGESFSLHTLLRWLMQSL